MHLEMSPVQSEVLDAIGNYCELSWLASGDALGPLGKIVFGGVDE